MTPTLYIAHGGGPCFFVDIGMGDAWDGMGNWLKQLAGTLPHKPKAMLVISAHWEEPEVTINIAAAPALLYDYYGFPPESYEIKYNAYGSPALAERVADLISSAGIKYRTTDSRGLDHGVFIPLKLVYPDADVPIVQLSLKAGLDPVFHTDLGEALAPLRKENVLIVGSGMSYHNLRAFSERSHQASVLFDDWLNAAACNPDSLRRLQLLNSWERAPHARDVHPREEHLIPLMVAAGAAGTDPGTRIYSEQVMGVAVSAFRFG